MSNTNNSIGNITKIVRLEIITDKKKKISNGHNANDNRFIQITAIFPAYFIEIFRHFHPYDILHFAL